MNFMVCPICKSNKNSNFRCEYKLEIHEDKKYFGNLKIDKCEECDFSYANPMPKRNHAEQNPKPKATTMIVTMMRMMKF